MSAIHSITHFRQRPPADGPPDGIPQSDRASPESIFRVEVPDDVLTAVRESVREVSYAEIHAAWAESIWSNVRLLCEDVRLTTCSREAFDAALPHLGTNRLRYVDGAWQWECRNYASLFCCVVDALLHVGCVGKVLDERGHHSYNVVILDDSGTLAAYGVEPQLDRYVLQLDPLRHYSGTGQCILGG